MRFSEFAVRLSDRPGRILALGLGIVALASPLHAATLEIVGPAGTEIVLDGELIGVLPLDPVELDRSGLFELIGKLRGHHSHVSWVDVPELDSEITEKIAPLSLDRNTAVISSAFVAGTGQLYQGRKLMGLSLLALQGAAWATVFWADTEFQTFRDDYELLDQAYTDAVVPSEIELIREQRDAAYDDMDKAGTTRNLALGAVIAISAYAVYDAWKGHDSFFAGTEVAPPSDEEPTTISMNSGFAIHAGWRKRF